LTFARFNDVNLASVLDEHIDKKHVEKRQFPKINEREVKVLQLICLPSHDSAIRFRPTIVNDIRIIRFLKPCRLILHPHQDAKNIKDQIVWQPVSDCFQDAPPSFEGLKNRCLFCNVSLQFRVHRPISGSSLASYHCSTPGYF